MFDKKMKPEWIAKSIESKKKNGTYRTHKVNFTDKMRRELSKRSLDLKSWKSLAVWYNGTIYSNPKTMYEEAGNLTGKCKERMFRDGDCIFMDEERQRNREDLNLYLDAKAEDSRREMSKRAKICGINEHVDYATRLAVNQNPEKIRKTAEKHRGMKRSVEAKKHMSLARKGCKANNKGMIWCHDPNDVSLKRFVSSAENIPDGWVRGFGKRERN